MAPDERGRHSREFVDQEWGSRGRLVLAALLLVAGAVVATVLLTGGDDSADVAASPARSTSSGPGTSGAPGSEASGSVPAPASAPNTASPLAGELLAVYQPQQVTRRAVEGGIRVTWQAPTRTEGIAGYLAIAQSPSGAYQKTAFPARDTMDALLSGSPVNADSCVVVVTLVGGAPGMKVAPGGPVCAAGGPGASGATPPKGATRKPESKP
ncbi:hypothetical protein [Embleya sp. NPDC020630]|uniref:hypothetical protein n=1 Tax=Embleya sp. NPDC020630 TaxID=3363979 RepID=UPI00379DA60E